MAKSVRYRIPNTFRFPGYQVAIKTISDKEFDDEIGEGVLAAWMDTEKVIYLRKSRSAKQRLADFAHEMGHVFMDWQENILGSNQADVKS